MNKMEYNYIKCRFYGDLKIKVEQTEESVRFLRQDVIKVYFKRIIEDGFVKKTKSVSSLHNKENVRFEN